MAKTLVGDTHNYFEFEQKAQNTHFDLFMPKPYRNGGNYNIGGDVTGFKSSVFVDGSINNPEGADSKWILEMAFPFSSLQNSNNYNVPVNGDTWGINFSRVQWKTEIVDGKYQKLKDPVTGRYLNEDNWVWGQQGVINMHFPERGGFAYFTALPVGGNKVAFEIPEEQILRKYLWLIYYKQQEYRRINGKFASSLSDLGLNEKLERGKSIPLS